MKKLAVNKYNILIIIIIIMSLMLFISLFNFNNKHKDEDEEIIFLKNYGDIKVIEDTDNVMSLGVIVYNYNVKDKQNDVKTNNVKFNNENIEVLDYDFVDSDVNFENARLFYLNINYKLNKDDSDNTYDSEFNVNNIQIGNSSFEIGDLYFFPVPKNYNENEDLSIDSVAAMSPGIGLKKFFSSLNNNTKDDIYLNKVDVKHFNNIIAQFILDDNRKTTKNYASDDLKIKGNSTSSFDIEFHDNLNNKYDVFYVSPVLEYIDSKKQVEYLYFDYFVSGLMLDKKDLKILLDKYN